MKTMLKKPTTLVRWLWILILKQIPPLSYGTKGRTFANSFSFSSRYELVIKGPSFQHPTHFLMNGIRITNALNDSGRKRACAGHRDTGVKVKGLPYKKPPLWSRLPDILLRQRISAKLNHADSGRKQCKFDENDGTTLISSILYPDEIGYPVRNTYIHG